LTERHLKLAAYLKIMSKFSIGRNALVFIGAEENPACPPVNNNKAYTLIESQIATLTKRKISSKILPLQQTIGKKKCRRPVIAMLRDKPLNTPQIRVTFAIKSGQDLLQMSLISQLVKLQLLR
jgi:hypothetical protein